MIFNGDTQVRLTHEQDKSNRLLLGDGFAVTVVERGEQSFYFNIGTDGNGYRLIIVEAGGFRKSKSKETAEPIFDDRGNPQWRECIYMNGMELMNFDLKKVPLLINETLGDIGWSKDDVGVFAMHQVNQTVIQLLANRLKVTPERMPIALQKTGNTSSASIPLMLATKREELRARNALNKVLVCGFGVGLSFGTVAVDLSSTTIHDTWII